VGGFRIGGKKSEAQVTVIVKLVDTTTSEIVAKERIVGKAGATAWISASAIAGVSTDLGGFKKTPLGQAAQDCINPGRQAHRHEDGGVPVRLGSVVKDHRQREVVTSTAEEEIGV